MRTSAVALCRRVNHYIEASVDPVTISNGEITWNILINNFGYSAQPDGTCIVTDYLGSGMEFISAEKYDRDGELEILEVTPQDNGQTKVVFKITGLKHDEVSKENRLNQNYTYDFNIRLKAKITNEDYLYGANSQYYNFGNKATYIDRFGNKNAPGTAKLWRSSIKKTMVYDESTAPYAKSSITSNKDHFDLNPEGDMVDIIDISNENLAIDPESITVEDLDTGEPCAFKIDTSQISENKVTIKVPDQKYVKSYIKHAYWAKRTR